jgi:hypothetical protein
MKKTDIAVILPAILVLLLTETVSYVTGYPEGLFLSRLIRGVSTRFVLIMLMLLAPLPLLPRLLIWLSKVGRNTGFIGQLASTGTRPYGELSKLAVGFFRPIQGIALSLIFAEKLLQLMEFSIGISPSRILVRMTLFMLGSILVSLLLSIIWTLDDLGVKMYNEKNGEVRLLGGTVGVVLPLITGLVGITTLFQHDTLAGVLTDLLGIGMILYPPYAIFAFIHYEFFRRRSLVLLQRLSLKRIETTLW